MDSLRCTSLAFFFFFSMFFCNSASNSNFSMRCAPEIPIGPVLASPIDVELLQFALNLEHLEADFFLYSSLGVGLDAIAPELAMGGPPPFGARKANLDRVTRSIIVEFGFEEVGHLRAIKSTVGGFPRPLLDLSARNFANIFNQALGFNLSPPFDPYANSVNFLLASYLIPYMGLVGYVGANPLMTGYVTKRLLAGLLGVEAGQDAVIRSLLYLRANQTVRPYNQTVAKFTTGISMLRNRLAMCGLKDEPIIVPPDLGAEGRSNTNVLSADVNSLSYTRSPEEILRVVYGTGDERRPGGFFPHGGGGTIAQRFLRYP